MKFLILFAFVYNTMAAPSTGMPSFEISGYFSRSAIPNMKVTFENGVTDDLVLEPYSESACNFIGRLANHPSSAAVTGCLNAPGDKMHITILADLNTKSHMYELDFDGNVAALENPFKYQKEPSGIYSLHSRENKDEYTKHDDIMKDEEKDPVMEDFAKAAASEMTSWPKKLYAKVKFGYENTMKAQLAADGTTFGKWIDEVMTHVQTYYKHPTLPTKIIFEYNKADTIFKNVNWPSTDNLNDASKAGWEDNDRSIDLYAWFGKDPQYYGTVGLAWVGGACNQFIQTSFNEHRKTPVETAMVVAHEMGHNFGMSHDFDAKHGGDNGYCNGQGIMSYGDAPSKWSTCSVNDFKGYYNEEKWGDTCLKNKKWTKPEAVCGKVNKFSNCDAMVYWQDQCMKKADYMIENCPRSNCPRTNCPEQCEDLCPGSACSISAPDICTNQAYGGCNGRYSGYYADLCKKTCNLC